jgi:hypothetical protein
LVAARKDPATLKLDQQIVALIRRRMCAPEAAGIHNVSRLANWLKLNRAAAPQWPTDLALERVLLTARTLWLLYCEWLREPTCPK